MNKKKIALITGATSGIGKSTSFALANNGYNLIITGRRHDRLKKVANEIISLSNVEVKCLNFDVRDNERLVKLIESLPDEWKKKIELLVNNAGLALGYDEFQNADINDWETMIDTNVKGLLYISKIVSNIMIKNKAGHIINISSIAGKQVYSRGNVYCASKHAVDAITKAMRIDLLNHEIRVSSISPGAIETEFSNIRFKGDDKKADNVYLGYDPLKPDDIADLVLFIANRPPHVNINDIEVTPSAQANAFYTNKKDTQRLKNTK